ncbi:MAG: zinc ABC transporter substrate-binding protein [Nitrospirota bacterium]
MKAIHRILLVLLLIAGLVAVSCQQKPEGTRGTEEKRLNAVASLFPLYDFARNIARDRAEITLLLPPGVEPHSFEPKPGDIVRLSKTDMLIYTNEYMEPWIDDILKGVANKDLLVIDSSKGISLIEETEEKGRSDEHERGDPHVWLDFSNAIIMVDNILEGFVKKDPVNTEFYRNNAAAYKAQLKALDEKFEKTLSGCKKKIFINGGHFTFGYLARRYHLKYFSAYGFSPNAEPSPRELAALSAQLKRHGLKHIFYEELITPRVARTIAGETGASLLMLHGAHNISREEFERGTTFLDLMEKNLENLKVGLQCR